MLYYRHKYAETMKKLESHASLVPILPTHLLSAIKLEVLADIKSKNVILLGNIPELIKNVQIELEDVYTMLKQFKRQLDYFNMEIDKLNLKKPSESGKTLDPYFIAVILQRDMDAWEKKYENLMDNIPVAVFAAKRINSINEISVDQQMRNREKYYAELIKKSEGVNLNIIREQTIKNLNKMIKEFKKIRS